MNISKLESRLRALEARSSCEGVMWFDADGLSVTASDPSAIHRMNYCDIKPTTGPPSSRPGFVKPDTPSRFRSGGSIRTVTTEAPAEPVVELRNDIPTVAPDDEPVPGTRAYRDRWGTRDTINK